MSTDTTPNLKLPFIMPSQAQKHVTYNEALRLLDGIIHLSVVSDEFNTPPTTPVEEARYIVAADAQSD